MFILLYNSKTNKKKMIIEKKISTTLLHFVGINVRSNQDLLGLIKETLYCIRRYGRGAQLKKLLQ